MFTKKDYITYLKEILVIELEMQHEADALLRAIRIPEAQQLLRRWQDDEIRHAKIARGLIKLVEHAER